MLRDYGILHLEILGQFSQWLAVLILDTGLKYCLCCQILKLVD